MHDLLETFVFKGMLLDASLEVLADSGLEVRGAVNDDRRTNEHLDVTLDDFPLEVRSGALRMFPVYVAFYCFENSVRKLVSSRLEERLRSDWWAKAIPVSVKQKVEDRKKKDVENKWHGHRGTNNIDYCDFGDLSDIIIKNWTNFEDLFPSQDWLRTRLNDLEPSRNIIAHNNVLSEYDIKRIDTFLRDWISQLG